MALDPLRYPTRIDNWDNSLQNSRCRDSIRFDFIDRLLHIESSDGATQTVELMPRSVADFYQAVMAALKAIDIVK